MDDLTEQYAALALANTRLHADLLRAHDDRALLRASAIDLLNNLALAAGDDALYFWKIGGRPLDDAYHALRAMLDATTKGTTE
jgi:hypothetical protein